jgi:hypothetical protein
MRVTDWKHFKKELLNKNIVVFGELISTVSANPAILSVSRLSGYIFWCVTLAIWVFHLVEREAPHTKRTGPNFGGDQTRILFWKRVCAAPLELFLMRAVKSREKEFTGAFTAREIVTKAS